MTPRLPPPPTSSPAPDRLRQYVASLRGHTTEGSAGLERTDEMLQNPPDAAALRVASISNRDRPRTAAAYRSPSP